MTPYYQDDQVTLYHGDCLDVMAALPDASVDAVVTDPPYGLEFMGKEWDRPWAVTATAGVGFEGRKNNLTLPSHRDSRNANCRTCGGRQRGAKRCTCPAPDWDRSPANDMREYQTWCTAWAQHCLRLLKPGGHLLAFGGTRTSHRLATAIEDAGFEIRDSIAWLYGSGFPKSLDVSKAIDRQRRDDATHVTAFLRAARGVRPLGEAVRALGFEGTHGTHGVAAFFSDDPSKARVPSPPHWNALRDLYGFGAEMDDEVARLNARKGQGSDEWNTRPVAEYGGRPGMAESWRDGKGWTGSAARGGDAVREEAQAWEGWGTALKPAFEPIVVARKPLRGTVAANVVEHGTGALNIDACRVAGDNPSIGRRKGSVDFLSTRPASEAEAEGRIESRQSPERFREERPGELLGRWPTNVVIDEHAAAEIDQQTGISRDGVAVKRNQVVGSEKPNAVYGKFKNHTAEDTGYGGEGGASRFFPTFRYEAKAPTAERPSAEGLAHPTVKPLDLMRWLVRLVTPTHGLVLDPFAGSGTTAEACIHEHMRCITIERETDYLPLIMARLSKPMAVGFDFEEPA